MKLFSSASAKSVLITGANRGLGLLLSKKLAAQGWEVYATAREQGVLQKEFAKRQIQYKECIAWDLCDLPSKDKIEEILAKLPAQLDAVIHCASPYMTKLIAETSTEEISTLINAMHNDTIFLAAMANKMKAQTTKAVLAVTGAVIGGPDFFSRGMMGLLKANQRQLSGILEHEAQLSKARTFFVRHFNLGSFREEAEIVDHDQYISIQYVAKCIISVLQHPESYSYNINLLSKINEKFYKVEATRIQDVSEDNAHKITSKL